LTGSSWNFVGGPVGLTSGGTETAHRTTTPNGAAGASCAAPEHSAAASKHAVLRHGLTDALRLSPAELFASLRAELRSGASLRGHLDELVIIEGMDHDLPRALWPEITSRIATLVQRVESQR
jgi:hypothetical protein